jgi:hypothetical protein
VLFQLSALPKLCSPLLPGLVAKVKPHTFCVAEDHWEQASLSSRSLTPLAFATTLISHESFDIGSGTRQARTQKDLVTLATEQCASILVKVRHRLTTSNRRPPKSSSQMQLTVKGNQHGKHLKGDSCRRNSCRKHRIPSIGCPQEQANFCSSERICRTKQARERCSCFCLGTAFC